jgi:hypothetical protein
MKWFLLLGLALSAGCLDSIGPQQDDELAAARARWDRAGLEDYRFRVDYTCFCRIAPHAAVVDVRQGVIAAVLDANTSAQPAYTLGMLTVPELFDRIALAIASNADEVTVRYDAQLGFPEDAFLDYIENAVDDEFRFQVSGLTSIE